MTVPGTDCRRNRADTAAIPPTATGGRGPGRGRSGRNRTPRHPPAAREDRDIPTLTVTQRLVATVPPAAASAGWRLRSTRAPRAGPDASESGVKWRWPRSLNQHRRRGPGRRPRCRRHRADGCNPLAAADSARLMTLRHDSDTRRDRQVGEYTESPQAPLAGPDATWIRRARAHGIGARAPAGTLRLRACRRRRIRR